MADFYIITEKQIKLTYYDETKKRALAKEKQVKWPYIKKRSYQEIPQSHIAYQPRHYEEEPQINNNHNLPG